MFRFFKRHRTPILVVVLVLLPLVIYRAHAVRPSRANLLDKVVLSATAPLRTLMMRATGAVSDVWYQYVDLVEARKQTADLAQKVQTLEREVDRLETVAVENAELRSLLKIARDNPETTFLVAEVIGMSISPSARTLEIDLGSLDGVPLGAPVITDQGLVGLVQRVGWTSSEVGLVVDESMALHAQVVRTRARGRLRGQGLAPNYRLELAEIMRSDDVRPGDRVVTSGLGKVFPKGLPVGEVVTLRTEPGVQHRIADVVPYVDFVRLERVSVVVQARPGEPVVTPEPLRPPSLRADPTLSATSSTASVAPAGPLGAAP